MKNEYVATALLLLVSILAAVVSFWLVGYLVEEKNLYDFAAPGTGLFLWIIFTLLISIAGGAVLYIILRKIIDFYSFDQ